MEILLVRRALLFLTLDFLVEIVGFEEYKPISQKKIRSEIRRVKTKEESTLGLPSLFITIGTESRIDNSTSDKGVYQNINPAYEAGFMFHLGLKSPYVKGC